MMCFVGREQRVRGDSSLKLSTKESNRSKIAAEDARATTEGEDCRHAHTGRMFVAVAAHLASAVAVDGGKVASFEGHEGRLAETWVKCRGRWQDGEGVCESSQGAGGRVREGAPVLVLWVVRLAAMLSSRYSVRT